MSANEINREELIAMLAWQVGCGADEAISDQPTADQPLQPVDGFVGSASTRHSVPAEKEGETETALTPSGHSPPGLFEQQGNAVETITNIADLGAIKSLAELRSALERLEGCALKNTASNLVFCDGNPGARVMIVGEAPGREEDRVGLPFVGAAGQLLDKMLATIGLDRASVYITNLLPWRPPGNRTPTAEETRLLLPYLQRHIQLADPEYVFILGGSSAKALLATKDGILKTRGAWRDIDFGDGVTRPTLASLHPAFLLRSPAQKRLSFDDLLSLRARLA
jgi:DNA polymerase